MVQQECIRYNKVIVIIHQSLKDFRKALKGAVVMTQELEVLGTQLFNNQVTAAAAQLEPQPLTPNP